MIRWGQRGMEWGYGKWTKGGDVLFLTSCHLWWEMSKEWNSERISSIDIPPWVFLYLPSLDQGSSGAGCLQRDFGGGVWDPIFIRHQQLGDKMRIPPWVFLYLTSLDQGGSGAGCLERDFRGGDWDPIFIRHQLLGDRWGSKDPLLARPKKIAWRTCG